MSAHPLVEAVARATEPFHWEAIDRVRTNQRARGDEIRCADQMATDSLQRARAAVLATLRGLREPSRAMGDAFDRWLPGYPLRDAWTRSVDGLIAEIGGPDA